MLLLGPARLTRPDRHQLGVTRLQRVSITSRPPGFLARLSTAGRDKRVVKAARKELLTLRSAR